MWGQGVVFPVLDHMWSPGAHSWISSPKGNGTLCCTNLDAWFITLPSSICCEVSSPLTWGKFVNICFIMEGGPPYTILYGEEPWDSGVILSLSRAVGNKPTQEQSVSVIHLESICISVRLVPSTIPELWGLYAVCNFHLMFKVLLTVILNQLWKPGHCPIQCWWEIQIWDLSP